MQTIEKTTPVRKINISGTLRQMEVNSAVMFPDSIEWSSIRSIAGKFNGEGEKKFSVKKVQDGYEVTRTR